MFVGERAGRHPGQNFLFHAIHLCIRTLAARGALWSRAAAWQPMPRCSDGIRRCRSAPIAYQEVDEGHAAIAARVIVK